MNARNRLVLFGEHYRLKNDWRTIAVAYSSQRHPFTSHMQPISQRQPICFSIPRVKPALTELAKQYFKCPLWEDTVGFVQFPIYQNLCLFVAPSPYTLIIRLSYRIIFLIFTLESPPTPLSSSFPPFCAFPPPYSTLLIFKSHMLPARLAQLHPANEGLFIGLRLSAAKQGLARAEAGASLAAPHPPAAQTTPHACSGLALSPRSRLLVSAVLNCRQQLKRATERERDIVERGEGTVLAC